MVKPKVGEPLSVPPGPPVPPVPGPSTLTFAPTDSAMDVSSRVPQAPVGLPPDPIGSHSSRDKKKKWAGYKRKRDFKELNERTVELECELDELKSAHDDDMKAKDKIIDKWKAKYENQLNKKKQAQQRYRRLKRRWEGGIFIPGKKSGPKPASLIGLSPRQIKRRRIAFSKDVTETVARIGLRHNMNLSDISIYMYGVKLIMPTELQLQNADRLRAESDEENNRNKFSDTSSDDDSDDDMKGHLDKKHRPPLAPGRRKLLPPVGGVAVGGAPPPPPEMPPPPPHHPPPPPPPGTTIAPLYGMHVNNTNVSVQESAQVLDLDAFEPAPQGFPAVKATILPDGAIRYHPEAGGPQSHLNIKPLPALPTFPGVSVQDGSVAASYVPLPLTSAQQADTGQSAPIYTQGQTFTSPPQAAAPLLALQASSHPGIIQLQSGATTHIQMSGGPQGPPQERPAPPPQYAKYTKFIPLSQASSPSSETPASSSSAQPFASSSSGVHKSVSPSGVDKSAWSAPPQPSPTGSGPSPQPQSTSIPQGQIPKVVQPNGRNIGQVY